MAAVAPIQPEAASRWRVWWMAARPRTLAISAAPVAVGTAVAIHEGGARWLPALAAFACALLLQIGSNLANDVFDFEKGADTDERLGPPRVTQLGLLSPAQMRRGMAFVFAAAIGIGLYLVTVAGWPIVVIGLLSIATAVAYTGGPWPLGYHGLGDLAVFLFFGVVAVAGSHYVQTLEPSGLALLASLPVGALATAILVVNNLRDVDTDRRAGKNTLAVRLGRTGARLEYSLLVGLAYAGLPLFARIDGVSWLVLSPLVTLPLAARALRVVWTTTEGGPLNETLAATAKLGLLFSLTFALGWVV